MNGLPNNFGRSVPKLKRLEMSQCYNLNTLPNSIGLLAHLVKLDLTSCENLTCLWENDANVQVKELFFSANGLVTHKMNPHLLLTFPTL